MPEAVRLESPYGKYQSSWKAEGNEVVFDSDARNPEHYRGGGAIQRVREFFEQVYEPSSRRGSG